MLDFRLAPLSEEDLDNIWFYSVRTWSVEQAEKYIDKIMVICAICPESVKNAHGGGIKGYHLKTVISPAPTLTILSILVI